MLQLQGDEEATPCTYPKVRRRKQFTVVTPQMGHSHQPWMNAQVVELVYTCV